MFFRKHERVFAPHEDVMVTKQSAKAECDIHNILSQYRRTGILAHVARAQAQFLDLPEVEDFQDALHQVERAKEAFAALPSAVRDRFGNDPGRFLAALSDPAERPFLEEVGVFRKASAAVAAPVAAPVAEG